MPHKNIKSAEGLFHSFLGTLVYSLNMTVNFARRENIYNSLLVLLVL